MPRYRIDVKLCATLYVEAKSAEEAEHIARASSGQCFGVSSEDVDIPISGLKLDDPKLPAVSISPVMTGYGLWDERAEPEEVD
jgi:hypothetical protein